MQVQLLTDYEKTRLSERQPLPDAYLRLAGRTSSTSASRAAKAALGDRLVILGHHYQRDEVIKFADYIGDSLKLAQYAASRRTADFVVFCGVHFMAESADVLGAPHQQVHPARPGRRLLDGRHGRDRSAGNLLAGTAGSSAPPSVVPVTYINSAAAIKGFCGEHGGIVCTSSNAAKRHGVGVGSRREDADAARPASGPQHRLPHGRAARSDGHVGSGSAVRRRRPRGAAPRAAHSLEGPLQRPHALFRPADRAVPPGASDRQGHRPSRMHVRRRAGRRRVRFDRVHHPHGEGQPGGIDLGRRHRDPPGEPARAAKWRRRAPS